LKPFFDAATITRSRGESTIPWPSRVRLRQSGAALRGRKAGPLAEVTLSIKHRPSQAEQPCGACGAPFVAAEDSGSRVLGLVSGKQEFEFLMCGGCHSKWAHGSPLRLRSMTQA
jgi:hypothetical protein